MKKKLFILGSLTLVLAFSVWAYLGDVFISFDDNESGFWTVSLADPNNNVAEITDNFDDVLEGSASGEVNVILRNYPASWGTWTDFKHDFDTPQDLGQATEMRFWVKMLERPSVLWSIQFTCDLFDQPEGASGAELFRWPQAPGDMDIFYNFHDDWYEVIIPFSAMHTPSWASSFNGVLDKDAIVAFAFGVHGDSTAPDSIRFLIDDLALYRSVRVADVFNFDSNEAGEWTVSLADPVNNIAEIMDEYDDVYEGSAAARVRVVLNNYPASWGTWTDFKHDFAQPLDLTGATELRFRIKIVQPPSVMKSIQFTLDLFDQPAGATGAELWRWPNHSYGIHGLFYNRPVDSWEEVVVPLADMAIPTWASTFNNTLDLNAITTLAFGVHGDSTAPDSVVFLIDDLHATYGEKITTLVETGARTPITFSLKQNYPNPFNPTTNIVFSLDENGPVTLKVYDLNGRVVKTIYDNAFKLRGDYKVEVDMSGMPSGVYFYKLTHNGRTLTRKMTLMK